MKFEDKFKKYITLLDETSHMQVVSQLATVLRYIHDGKIQASYKVKVIRTVLLLTPTQCQIASKSVGQFRR
jgi:hypothetical protein